MHTHSPQTPRRVISCGRLLGTHPQPVSTPTPSQTPLQVPALTIKTHVKAGAIGLNHNETLVRATPRPRPRAVAAAGRARSR